jgi:hypothetical protein
LKRLAATERDTTVVIPRHTCKNEAREGFLIR